MKKLGLLLLLCLPAISGVFGQGKLYDGPDDPAGDIAAKREGYMTGNRIFLYFQNQMELSDWPRVEVSKWPNDYTGVKMTDGINLLVTSQVFLEQDSIPVTDPERIATETLDTLWYCQTAFRGGLDLDPTGTIQWGFYPVFGYFNELDEYPAMSNLPESWPPNGWPARGNELKWPGVWNGRFGLGVQYADMETYFVANDAQDLEYLNPDDTLTYSPRPGVKIGDKNPNVTIQYGEPWGGLGVRVETRGYQWNNPLARDAIFWEYNVANISDYDLPQVALGYHVDNAIGNDSNDEIGFFDTYLDLAYSWDIDGVGQGGLKTGTMGFAYLESPGLAYDGVDNDEDGLLDEKRDNETAGDFVGPTEGIDDLDKFLEFYRLEIEDLKDHWSSDEDQDWNDGDDKNDNGIYDPGENPGDDVGLDGIGPDELNYPGPDQGECNHRPDYKEGIGCEPNYNATDVTESDMLGLTSFSLFFVQEKLEGKDKTFREDWVMWQLTGTGMFTEFINEISNLIEVFASGPFPLYKGRTERVSMSILHSFDQLSDLSQQPPRAPVLFELKKIVQLIYEKDYRFAQPPKMPTLTATAYDGKVVLTWDDAADKSSREPFLGGANDFEGYKLIRATDKKFQDAQVVTDGFGTPAMYKPIYQCDLKDGKRGFTTFGMLNGMGYYLGDDTGITHYFVDENVQNGMTYYYGLMAYDYGIDEETAPPGIAPSENNLVIELDEYEQIRHIGQNVQVVTPRATAPGYTAHSLEILTSSIKETAGSVTPDIFAKNALKEEHVYTFKFDVDTLTLLKKTTNHGYYYLNNGYTIYDVTDSSRAIAHENPDQFILDNLVYDAITDDEVSPRKEWFMKIGSPMKSDVADGAVMTMEANIITSIHGGYDYVNSGWAQGAADMEITPTRDAIKYFPWDYELIFTNNPNAYVGKVKKGTIKDDSTKVDKDQQLVQLPWSFFMINKTFPTTDGEFDTLDIVGVDDNLNGVWDWAEDRVLFCAYDAGSNRWKKTVFVIKFGEQPQPGDVYYMTFNRPHFSTDSLSYRILPEGALDTDALNNGMEAIRVVPNPYIATNDMEPVVSNWYLNQQRSIMFTHLPAQCTITIFTVSGVFVDEIDVANDADNGVTHWNVETAEGLEVAAGMYLYHVKAELTGAEKVGKFAIIK